MKRQLYEFHHNGLLIFFETGSARFTYTMVVLTDLCPNKVFTLLISVPDSTRSVAKQCLNV